MLFEQVLSSASKSFTDNHFCFLKAELQMADQQGSGTLGLKANSFNYKGLVRPG